MSLAFLLPVDFYNLVEMAIIYKTGCTVDVLPNQPKQSRGVYLLYSKVAVIQDRCHKLVTVVFVVVVLEFVVIPLANVLVSLYHYRYLPLAWSQSHEAVAPHEVHKIGFMHTLFYGRVDYNVVAMIYSAVAILTRYDEFAEIVVVSPEDYIALFKNFSNHEVIIARDPMSAINILQEHGVLTVLGIEERR